MQPLQFYCDIAERSIQALLHSIGAYQKTKPRSGPQVWEKARVHGNNWGIFRLQQLSRMPQAQQTWKGAAGQWLGYCRAGVWDMPLSA